MVSAGMEDLAIKARKHAKALAHWVLGRRCAVCGKKTVQRRSVVLWPELVNRWGLDSYWEGLINQREGTRCANCGSTRRSQQMASTIVQEIRMRQKVAACNLDELLRSPHMTALSVAMINGCGTLTSRIRSLPHVAYSEYRSADPQVPSEDLMSLSYHDEQFDLVLTSDTLEHVPNLARAQREIYRVLKPGGLHIFTIPIIWDRSESRKCAELVENSVKHLRPPTYHGSPGTASGDLLVFWEFGGDVTSLIALPEFPVRIYRDRRNPALTTCVAQRSVDDQN